MASSVVEDFIQRLLQSEATGRAEPVAAAFAPDARLERPVRGAGEQLPPLEFWQGYLESFERIGSEFTKVTEADGFASLEWVSHAKLPGGREIDYRGVTLLEHDGERMHAMRTYYDSAPFTAAATASAARSRPGRSGPNRPRDDESQRSTGRTGAGREDRGRGAAPSPGESGESAAPGASPD